MYEASGKLPQALRDKPSLPWYLHDYLRAFLDLNRRREYFMAQQPLQLSEIACYCREFDFDEDKEFFFKMMFECDAEYMEHHAEKAKQERELEKAKKPGKGFGRPSRR
jgi:hypothetical protein